MEVVTGQTNETARAGLPAHEQVYRQLRDLVLFGELVPGQPVTIAGLQERTGSGMTPVREAIRRLTTEGALQARGNRRVVVPRLDAGDIDELELARLAIEPVLAARAADRITAPDIEDLEAIDAGLDRAISVGDVEGYLRQNNAFHGRLYRCAGAPILHGLVNGLWLRFGPSMRVVCGRWGTARLPDRHKDVLADLARADAQAAADAIRADIAQGMAQLREALEPG